MNPVRPASAAAVTLALIVTFYASGPTPAVAQQAGQETGVMVDVSATAPTTTPATGETALSTTRESSGLRRAPRHAAVRDARAVEEPETTRRMFDQPVDLTIGAAGSSDNSGGLRVHLAVGDEMGSGLADLMGGSPDTEPGVFHVFNNGFIDLAPVVDIESSDEDGFNHVIAKLSGNMVFFPVEKQLIEGGPEPVIVPGNGLWHLIPISAGIEADDEFRFVDGLFEIGYIPWLTSGRSQPFELGWNPSIGAFLQLGYKFDARNADANRPGAAADESAEDPDSGIGRLKLRARGDFAVPQFERVTLRPEGAFWWDFWHGEAYYRLSAIADVKLSETRSLEFRWDKGSGAPNFNDGNQFGIGLKIEF